MKLDREQINKAIFEKTGKNPQDRFRIIWRDGNIVEVFIRWDKYDTEIMSVII